MRAQRIIRMINEANLHAGDSDHEPRASVEALFVVIAVLLFLAMVARADRPLTFDDRVRAQEAIERVYYNHRIWPKENPSPKPPFEQMISRAQIEAKAEDYLKKSAALDKLWQRPIQPEQLQAEMDRMVKGTKDSPTLMELFVALDNDPYLIAECLAMPVLADRLVHNWYGADTRFHAESREKAERAMKEADAENLAGWPEGEYHKVIYRLKTGQEKDGEEFKNKDEIYLNWDELEKIMAQAPEQDRLMLRETSEALAIERTVEKTDESIVLESIV